MEEDETITAYNKRINDMENEAFALGEPMSNKNQMRFESTESAKKKDVALKARCKEGNEEDLNETMNLVMKILTKP
ncbi:hypothetical protein LIER_30753 [Lithospermum erythrorhizon]|uniref:Gag-pol polyprotein n=1 Tax=Lithospermum erythrorhizon TaxID=34254 RepID=A0AAV3RR32_LITER